MIPTSFTLLCVSLLQVSGRIHNCTYFIPTDTFPRIMVTGGAGFIGSTLVKRLKNTGYTSVKIIDNFSKGKRSNLIGSDGSYVVDEHHDVCVADLAMAPAAMSLLKNVDWIIHLADVFTGRSLVSNNNHKLFRSSNMINSNVVTSASRHKVSKFVFVGTACSFPEQVQDLGTINDPVAFDENQISLTPSESSFGWSKLIGEYEVSLMLKMNSSILRLHDVYGPGADYADTTADDIPSIIRKAINSPSEIYRGWGDGSQYRDFVFVDDVVDALIASVQKDNFDGSAQIGTGVAKSLLDAAQTVASLTSKCLGKQLEVIRDTASNKRYKGRVAIIKKAQTLLSWTPKVSFDHGLSMNYAWILRDMAAKSDNGTKLLEYALCIDETIEAEKQKGWIPPVRQAKGLKMILARPPGDVSAVFPHFFCESERQIIMKKIMANPPPRKTLVVLQSSTRGGHLTFESFAENVLKHLDADLALAVETQEYKLPDAFRNVAKYVWEVNPPKDNNYRHFFDEISKQCYNHPFNESYAHEIGHSTANERGWVNCIANQHSASLIIFFRWFALQGILRDKLYEKYDTVIVSRSDELWLRPHDNSSIPVQHGNIHVPIGEDYGGLSDRHYMLSMHDAINGLGMADILYEKETAKEQIIHIASMVQGSAENLEAAHKMWFESVKKMKILRWSSANILVADSSDMLTHRWRQPSILKYHGMYLNVKYDEEYALMQRAGFLV